MASSCASWLELEVGVLDCLAVALVVALEVGALVWLVVPQEVALRSSRSSALFSTALCITALHAIAYIKVRHRE